MGGLKDARQVKVTYASLTQARKATPLSFGKLIVDSPDSPAITHEALS